MNGLRVVIDDYVRTRSWRLALQSTIGVLTLIFFMLGTITLITFQPVPGTVAGYHCL
jgi:succinate dehydrogenase / fumarate reductase membrane anchor subunit